MGQGKATIPYLEEQGGVLESNRTVVFEQLSIDDACNILSIDAEDIDVATGNPPGEEVLVVYTECFTAIFKADIDGFPNIGFGDNNEQQFVRPVKDREYQVWVYLKY